MRSIFPVAAVVVLAAISTVAGAPPAAKPAEPLYTVRELRFPDSPDHGAAFEREPGRFGDVVCYVTGISQDDCITGGIVAADNSIHSFIFEKGEIRDLSPGPGRRARHQMITDDGTVIAVDSAYGKLSVLMYKDGKTQDITPKDAAFQSIGQPTSDGHFLIQAFAESLLVSVQSPMVTTKVPTGKLTDSGLIFGVGEQDAKATAFTFKDGQTHWVPEIVADQKGHLAVADSTRKGPFAVFSSGTKAWLVNGLTNTVVEVTPPTNVKQTGFLEVYVDEQGVVAGELVGEAFKPTPFIFRDGKFILLTSKVPAARLLGILTPTGLIFGTLNSGHLFRYDGRATKDLGGLGGEQAGANRYNAAGQIVGVAADGKGVEHAFVTVGDKVVDLNQFLPKDSKYVLRNAQWINDHGTVVAEGIEKDVVVTRDHPALRRMFVLIPATPTPSPTSKPATAPARK